MHNSRISVAHWLWNHNPFYVISSLLMLYGVRVCYGTLNIGTINCWGMMGILGGYTLVLATVGILIVRWGKVWDDARSILLLLLLLFLAVSISADDLFVKMESTQGGAALMGCGFGFSVAVLLAVLYATRIRLQPNYLIPLILFLALFFFAPWWCSPELHPKDVTMLDWTLFLFPQVAAFLLLTLIPAARLGQLSVKDNGTPWPWPLFPWTAFFFIGIAVILRSYALTLTFSQSGPVWTSAASRSGIVLDTIWRPYFLVPFALAALILVFESGLATGNRRLVTRVLLSAPLLLLLAWPFSPSRVMSEFLTRLTWTVGSPIWLTVWLLIAFYASATLRRIPRASIGLLASILVLSIVGPKTISVATMTSPNPVPLFVVATIAGIVGVYRRSSPLALAATSLATAAVWIVLSGHSLAAYRTPLCYHLVLASCLLFSVLWHDHFSRFLQIVSATGLIGSALFVLVGSISNQVPHEWRLAYIASLCGISVLCGYATGGRAFWTSFAGTLGLLGYAVLIESYRYAAMAIGREAMAAFSWSAGTLIIGVMISAQKAQWLPSLRWPHWFDDPLPQSDLALAESPVPDEQLPLD